MLSDWLPPNDAPERPQLQLATVDGLGRPDVRTVLLSEWDAEGFVFHTDAGSRKAAQLAVSPWVALVLLWPGFSRQLVVRGAAEVADRDRLDRAFAARSPYLKQLAWQNSESMAQLDRASRVEEWRRFSSDRDPAGVAAPTGWTGYLVRPDRLTFWQPDADGPSHRIEFRSAGDGAWSEHHLPG